jgi:hypothetical protein
MQKGYSGGLLLANKVDHKMLATDEASHWFRVFGAEAFDGKVKDFETYEVYRARLDHPEPRSHPARDE